jgi:hypothetical protein
MDYKKLPLSEILREREIFVIFDEEFQKDTWLDVTALQASDSTIEDLRTDGTVPEDVLVRIEARIERELNL